jgi:hypothetical protein
MHLKSHGILRGIPRSAHRALIILKNVLDKYISAVHRSGEASHVDQQSATKTAQHRKSRRGSENRRMSAQFTMRMTEQARAKLDEVAREQGFKDAKALVMFRLRDDLAGLELVS